jgi:hypothetical protein
MRHSPLQTRYGCRLSLALLVAALIVSTAPAAAADPRLEAARKEGRSSGTPRSR